MNARLRLLAAAAIVLPSAAAVAQPQVRPGLWEETISVKTDNAQANAQMEQMKQRMAAMPPEQRAAMEKMMASHGMGMGGSGGGNTVRVCVSKEQAERGFHPEERGHCSRSNISTSGNVTRFDFACQSERGNVTGHGTYTAMGDAAFAATSVADTVTQKSSMHVESDIQGKFVSSDCGDVKPMDAVPLKLK